MFEREIEAAPRGKIREIQNERARYTAKYAFEHSPFYHDLFREHNVCPDDIRSPEDLLKRLPIITKKEVTENQPPLCREYRFFSAPKSEWSISNYTSGTQGISKIYLRSHDDIRISKRALKRAYDTAGVKKKDTVMIILPYGMGTSGIAATRGFEDFAHVLTAGLGNNPSRTELIKHNRPGVIFGSPSSVARLARQIELDGLVPHETSVRRILTVSEPMSRERQKFIAGRWDADVYNNYASTEGDLMASECRFHEGLHQVKEDYLWMSAIDLESKEMLEYGKPGADVITTLIEPGTSCGMVLINYHHGDKFAVLDGGCPCERTSLRMTPPIRIGDNELEVGYIRIGLDDLEAMIFRPEFNDYLTGEYEVLKGYDPEEALHKIKVRVETRRPPPDSFAKKLNDSVHRHFTLNIVATGESKVADILMEAVPEGGLEISSMPGKPKRIINKESKFWL